MPEASLQCLSERPFRARLSGTLLEFLQLRSDDRRTSVSSSFPSRPNQPVGSPLLRQHSLSLNQLLASQLYRFLLFVSAQIHHLPLRKSAILYKSK